MLYSRHATLSSVALSIALAVVVALTGALSLATQPAMAAPAANQGNPPTHRTYVVRTGDTLSAIALRFGITQDALMRANNIRNANVVYVGQTLIIPGGHGPGTPPQPVPQPSRPTTYVVKRGDTLGDIAKRFNTTVQALMQANNLKNPNRIEVGQVLNIPGQGGKDPVGPVHPPVQPPVYPPAHPPVIDHGKDPVYPPVYRPEPHRPEPQRPEPYRPEPQRPAHPTVHPGYKPDHKPEARPTDTWKGSYYAGKYFEHLVMEREDADINFNWYADSPGAGIPEDRFSVRWERHTHFQPGWYRFTAVADDGVRVFVDDTLIIDGWKIQPATEYTADVYLTGGVHKLNVDYFEEGDAAQIRVSYERLQQQPPVIKR